MNFLKPSRKLKARRPDLCLGTAVVGLALAFAAPVSAAVCDNLSLTATCTVDAALPTNSTGITLTGGVYTFTVNNPATQWYVAPTDPVTNANGGSPTMPNGASLQLNAGSPLVPGPGGSNSSGVGYVPVQASFGGLTANYGALVAHIGNVYQPIAAQGMVLSGANATGALSLQMWGNQPDPTAVGQTPCVSFSGSCGTQSVTIAQSTNPHLLAGVNVFAKEHALSASTQIDPATGQPYGPGKVSTGVIMDPSKAYYIVPTNPNQLWSIGPDTNRTSTAAGVDPTALVFNGTYTAGQPNFVQEGLCTAPLYATCAPQGGNTFGDTPLSQTGPGGTEHGYRFNELVALVGGKYYAVGQGVTLTGLSGELFLLDWDSDASDNFGFINVAIYDPAVPEPASMMLLGTALIGFGLARWRKKETV